MKYVCLIVVCFFFYAEISAQGKLVNNDCSAETVRIEKEKKAKSASAKLKSTLLENLVKDEMITSKYEMVELEFLHNKVLLNKEEMNVDCAEKYTFMLKGLGFRSGDRYVIHLRPNTMSMKAYDRNGKLLQELLVEEGSWSSAL